MVTLVVKKTAKKDGRSERYKKGFSHEELEDFATRLGKAAGLLLAVSHEMKESDNTEAKSFVFSGGRIQIEEAIALLVATSKEAKGKIDALKLDF